MSFVNELRNDNGIKERKLADGISSFNFTSKTFKKKNWNDRTVKARGLFINTNNDEIVARSYDKFFAIGERPETQIEALEENLQYPVKGYVKENGFLGIASGRKDGTLFVASKSTNEGDFAELFGVILDSYFVFDKGRKEQLAYWLYEHNLSLVFEVIDPIRDPHIVKYSRNHLVLLDIIENTIDFHPMPMDCVRELANKLEIPYKVPVFEANSFEEVEYYLSYWENKIDIEGLVLCDADNFMFKMKTKWYKYWKHIRTIAQQLAIKTADSVKGYSQLCENDPAFAVFLCDYINIHGYTSVINIRDEWEAKS